MHGEGTCPLHKHVNCHKGHSKSPIPCEFWNEYEGECSVNLIAMVLIRAEKRREE